LAIVGKPFQLLTRWLYLHFSISEYTVQAVTGMWKDGANRTVNICERNTSNGVVIRFSVAVDNVPVALGYGTVANATVHPVITGMVLRVGQSAPWC
jgi:hypothetical protein